jgi:hypothetical protein
MARKRQRRETDFLDLDAEFLVELANERYLRSRAGIENPSGRAVKYGRRGFAAQPNISLYSLNHTGRPTSICSGV